MESPRLVLLVDASKKVLEEERGHKEPTKHSGTREQSLVLLRKVGPPERMEDQSLR